MSIIRRSRLNLESVPPPTLTFSSGESVNPEYEDFILGSEAQKVQFPHWTAHLRYFFGWYSEAPDFSCAEADFPRLRQTIADGLRIGGYLESAGAIQGAASDTELNATIINQYTDESNLYNEINRLLRKAHSGTSIAEHPLCSWILQFNVALRIQPEFDAIVYRGVDMADRDIDQYQQGLMFQWASFVSASKDRETALDYRGNVLFDITPWGSYSMYGKRNPFDIAKQSTFPDEQEVVFPIACTFRVKARAKDGHRALISLETVDQY